MLHAAISNTENWKMYVFFISELHDTAVRQAVVAIQII
jgi:hypothetical protein